MNHHPRLALWPSLLICTASFASAGPAAGSPQPSIVAIEAGTDSRAVVDAGRSRIEHRTARIGLRDIDLAVRAIPPQIPRRPNLCVNRSRAGFPKPSCNSCEPSYGDCVWAAIDGVPWEGDFEWSSDYRNPEVPFYQVDFGRAVTIGEIRVWLRRGYPMRDFDVRYRDVSGEWRTVSEVRGSTAELRAFAFPPVAARVIGVTCLRGPDHQPTIRRIVELEAFGPRAQVPAVPRSFTYAMSTPRGGPLYLDVREAYGESDTLAEVDYDVRVNGVAVCHRSHRCDGPGPISYSAPIAIPAGRRARIAFVDTSGQGLSIARVRIVADPVGQSRSRNLLHPLIVAPRIELHAPYTDPRPAEALDAWVQTMVPARAYLQPGLLAIVGYANPDAAAVEAKIRAYAALAARCRVPWVLQLSSWWADTPLRVPDGLGGTFGDIQYQQIGYSRFDNYDDPGLREFVEAEAPGTYSVHYGLTVPNIWSDTPWLTMNNQRLNAFKVECLRRALAVVNEVRSGPDGQMLRAIVTDDEPIYWTRAVDWMERGYGRVNNGVVRSDLILDFNPAVVRAAAADGVRLDPARGLGAAERLWLHENNSRYAALMCRTIFDALGAADSKSERPDLRDRVFNYLLAQPLYPLEDYGHPGWEIGTVPHAAVGLEAGDERYFERARDLGPLANSDFECANPSAQDVAAWEPRFRAWHDVGCQFVQLCNPGLPSNWKGLFERAARWNSDERMIQRSLSALVQEAAAPEWRRAKWRQRFVPPSAAKAR